MRTFGLSLLVLIFALPLQAAPPEVHTQPFFQSPVRGEPDDLLILPGHGFLPGAEVAYQRLDDTTVLPSPPAELPSSATAEEGTAPIVSLQPEAVVVRLPLVMLTDVSYVLWVRNPDDEWSEGIRINDARPLWVTPTFGYQTAQLASLPRELKVVGRNLQPAPGGPTMVRLTGPAAYEREAENDGDERTTIEHYVARITLPDSTLPGDYQVEVSRDGTSWIGIADQVYTVLPDPVAVPQFQVSDAAFGGCFPDDGDDDALCVKNAIDAALAAGGGDVVFGAGRWDLELVPETALHTGQSHGILVHPDVNLIGQGSSSTQIVRTAEWGFIPGVCEEDPCVGALFTLQGGNKVDGIHFHDEFADRDFRFVHLQLGKRPWWLDPGDPQVIEDVVITHNHFTDMNVAIRDGNLPLRRIFVIANELQAYRDDLFLGGNSQRKDVLFQVEDSIVAHNVFYPGDFFSPETDQGVIASQIGAALRLDFSNNLAEGRAALAPPTGAGHCSTLPSGCGWRAAHFWHMNNSHEKMLVSVNLSTCTGDKAGDGEAIVFDNNHNEPGLIEAQPVLSASATTVEVEGPMLLEGPGVDPDYYTTYWMQVADGKGVGQTRKLVFYLAGPDVPVLFGVDPPWDIVPEPGSSRVTVLRQDWQIYVVDNLVDIRECEKDNPNEPSAGVIHFHGNTSDSTIEGNVQYESDGIRLGAGYSVAHDSFVSWAKYQYFNEVRDNEIYGEYNFNDCSPGVCIDDCCKDSCCDAVCDIVDHACAETACCSEEVCCVPEYSWSGIELVFGSDPDSPSPTIGHGNIVARNTVSQADALRGGAIAVDRGWHQPPTPYQYRNTLIHHNAISDLERRNESGECLPYNPVKRDGGVGIHIQESFTWNTVLYENTFEDVCFDVVDFGTNTTMVGAQGPGTASSLVLRPVAPEEIELSWTGSTCGGLADYAIYEGALGNWNSLTSLTCHDTAGDLTEIVDASGGDRFYLVVPQAVDREGSYGSDGYGSERATAGAAACIPFQDLSCD